MQPKSLLIQRANEQLTLTLRKIKSIQVPMKGKARFLKLETPCYIIYHMLGDNRTHTLDFKQNLEGSVGP